LYNTKQLTMKTRTELLEDLIKDSKWALRYHKTKLKAESNVNNPDEWQVRYHTEQIQKNELMIEQLKK